MHLKALSLSLATLLALGSASQGTPQCFNNPGSLQPIPDASFVSLETCEGLCRNIGLPIAGTTSGDECWCGDAVPLPMDMVNEKSCDSACAGYPSENCTCSPRNVRCIQQWLTSIQAVVTASGLSGLSLVCRLLLPRVRPRHQPRPRRRPRPRRPLCPPRPLSLLKLGSGYPRCSVLGDKGTTAGFWNMYS